MCSKCIIMCPQCVIMHCRDRLQRKCYQITNWKWKIYLANRLILLSCLYLYDWGVGLHTTLKTLGGWSLHIKLDSAYTLNDQKQTSVSAFTFESSACKKYQAAGTSPYWRVCVRWALKEKGSGETASPGGTRLVWLGPSEPETKVPCDAHRRAVSSCDG